MNLQKQKFLYVQSIYYYFQGKANWPTYKEVDLEFSRSDRSLDIEEIVKNLQSGFANSLSSNRNFDEQAILSLSAICQCKGSEEDLDNFVKAIRLFADMFYNKAAVTELTVTGADLWRELEMSESDIKKVGLLLKGETFLYSSSGVTRVDGYGSTWLFKLAREIRKFDGVQSIDDYLERRDKPNSRTTSLADQMKSLLGYMYRKSGSEDVISGGKAWAKKLTEPDEKTGGSIT